MEKQTNNNARDGLSSKPLKEPTALQREGRREAGPPRTRILLADDHRILRSGLRGLLEKAQDLEVVGEADDGRSAIELTQKLSPDVVVMDISMNDLNGIEATRQIVDTCSKTKVIILSVHSGQKLVSEVFKAGASGYLMKDCDFSEVLAAIHAVATNKTYLCPQIATVLHNDYLRRVMQDDLSASAALTPREREVLQLMAEGKSTKEIAFALDLSVKTVEVHRQRIMEKLNIHSIAELTKYAIREGITTLDS